MQFFYFSFKLYKILVKDIIMRNCHRKRKTITALVSKINSLNHNERKELAHVCGTSIGNLRQIAYGFGGVSPRLAKSIVQNAGCNITIGELLPELAD